MNDPRPSDPAGQPCIGPDGHIPLAGRVGTDGFALVPRYRAPVPGFPDVVLYAEAAAVGNPCVGTITDARDEEDHPVGAQHVIVIRAQFDPPEPSAPSACIGLAYDDAGTLRQGLRMVDPLGVEMLPLDRAARLTDAWRAALRTGRITLVDFTAYLTQLRDAYNQLKPGSAPHRPTHQECADKLDVLIDASEKRFERAGTNWRKETHNW